MFKKSHFKIITKLGTRTMEGYTSKNFGIYKRDKSWVVAHLPSGLRFRPFEMRLLHDTKKKIERCEKALDMSGKTVEEISEKNGMTTRELYDFMTGMG